MHAGAELRLSAMQAQKALNQGASAVCLLVTMSEGTDSVNVVALAEDSPASAQQNTADLMPVSDLQTIKNEYAERFPLTSACCKGCCTNHTNRSRSYTFFRACS